MDNLEERPIPGCVRDWRGSPFDRWIHSMDNPDGGTIAKYVTPRRPRHLHRTIHPRKVDTGLEMLLVSASVHIWPPYHIFLDNVSNTAGIRRTVARANVHTWPRYGTTWNNTNCRGGGGGRPGGIPPPNYFPIDPRPDTERWAHW